MKAEDFSIAEIKVTELIELGSTLRCRLQRMGQKLERFRVF